MVTRECGRGFLWVTVSQVAQNQARGRTTHLTRPETSVLGLSLLTRADRAGRSAVRPKKRASSAGEAVWSL